MAYSKRTALSVPLIEYSLTPEQTTNKRTPPDESAKLLIYRRHDESLEHTTLGDLPTIVRDPDALILRNTQTSCVRLGGTIISHNIKIEILLLRELHPRGRTSIWETYVIPSSLKHASKTGKQVALNRGVRISCADGVSAKIQNSSLTNGTCLLQFSLPPNAFYRYLASTGRFPALPLASSLIDECHKHGANKVLISSCKHPAHEEAPWLESITISPEAAASATRLKREGGRIIAIGVSAAHAVETAADKSGTVHPFCGDSQMCIIPGYEFRAVDILLTAFHQPRSVPLAFTAAFIGSIEATLAVYQEALDSEYQFLPGGDMLLIC